MKSKKVATVSYLCKGCGSIIDIEVEDLRYDTEKLLASKNWIKKDGYFFCNKCKNTL